MNKKNDVDLTTTSHEEVEMGPPPVDINEETGQKLWLIKEYKIWAHNYQQALNIVSLIEQNLYEEDNQ